MYDEDYLDPEDLDRCSCGNEKPKDRVWCGECNDADKVNYFYECSRDRR